MCVLGVKPCVGYRGCCHIAQMVGIFIYLFDFFGGGARRGEETGKAEEKAS